MEEKILEYEEKKNRLVKIADQELPGVFKAFSGPVKDEVYINGAMDIKTKRLISIAIAVQAGCKDCMIFQTSEALKEGATVEEITESCGVAISMGGTLASSKALVVLDYLQAKGLIS